MPDWCRTTIHARNSKQYQELIAELKNHNANADPSFNNLIPMPPELRLQESSMAEKAVLIYVNALAVKLIHFSRQRDTANATEIKNYLKAYKTGVANMQYALGFKERLSAIDTILKLSDTSFQRDILTPKYNHKAALTPIYQNFADDMHQSFKDTLKRRCQDFVAYILQADDNRGKLKELINDTIILPKNASDDPYKLTTQYNLTADDKWLDPNLKDIPYLTVLYNIGKKYFDNVVKYHTETWYRWSTRNWGTKWDLSEYATDDHASTIMFNTAWSTPVPILKKLAALHGNFNIDVDSESTSGMMHIRVTKDELEDNN